MGHVSHRLKNSFQGALAGGGDPATSPLYVFGPFLRLIVVAGVAEVTFGASVWLVVFTVAVVSAMYRQVMRWVTDGSGGSGLSEEEFGGWAVKVNAGITFVEYTLTFLVSMAALVTLTADRYPVLNEAVGGVQYRTMVAVALTFLTAWLVNLGPKMAARAFGPATLGVLALLWAMVIATVWRNGFQLPDFQLKAFTADYAFFTAGGYVRLLALMTGIEIFANLVAAYDGTPGQRSKKAFGSLVMIMGTTSITMLIVGPAILKFSNPSDTHVSVFTQTMDQLLPAPLPWIGTLIGIVVLASASAASAQGLQNLALGLRYRHYVPAALGQRNRYDVADKPVWIEAAIVAVCYLAFGTNEETYLALYAAGVFILLSMTGWAAAKRQWRELRAKFKATAAAALSGTVIAAILTSFATALIFTERFKEGAWTYLLFIPLLYAGFSVARRRLGEPVPLEEHLGRFFTGQYLLPYERAGLSEDERVIGSVLVPLDGSTAAEASLPVAMTLCKAYGAKLGLISAVGQGSEEADRRSYLETTGWGLKEAGLEVDHAVAAGKPEDVIRRYAQDLGTDLIVMTTHGRSGVESFFVSAAADRIMKRAGAPVVVIRPTEEWRSRRTQFKRLMVNLDGSANAERALRYARAIGQRFGSEIVILAVPESDNEEQKLTEYVETVAAALKEKGLSARWIVTGSGPARTIVAVSEEENVDLILMATHGRGGTRRAVSMGSVTDRVMQITQRPMLVVPARD